MVSEFRRKKYVELFNSFDTDASGGIEQKDFEIAAESLAKTGDKVDDAKRKEYLSILLKIWDGVQSQCDTDKDGSVSLEEWIAAWDATAKNFSASQEWQNIYCRFTFQLLDSSNDECINNDEFVKAYEAWGFKKNDAVSIFQKLSRGKASISWAEFQELWKEYVTSDDPNALGNYLFTTPS